MSWYRTGTVSVTNNNVTVTGTGTAWIANAQQGMIFLGPDNSVYEIGSVNADGQLTLARPYRGSTANGQAYDIAPTQDYLRTLAAQVASLVNTYSTIASNAGAGKFGDGTAAAPGITFGANPNTGFFRYGANALGFAGGGALRMLLDGSGHLSIGTTSAGGGMLNVAANGGTVGAIGASLPVDSTSVAYSSASVQAGSGGWYHFVGQSGNGSGITTNTILISGNGNIGNANNVYGAVSDQRLKQDITDAASQWADIKALRIRKFRFKADPTAALQIGVIAQEAEQVSPGLVSESPGVDTGSTYKAVAYSVLYVKAIKCLQEAMARIEALEMAAGAH